ncbi:MAG: hypothetical protein SFX74_12925 [Fimbriimonadaceae bacterium]|nr:hypothetical protein [Fimbriimonadaceae bacterium]
MARTPQQLVTFSILAVSAAVLIACGGSSTSSTSSSGGGVTAGTTSTTSGGTGTTSGTPPAPKASSTPRVILFNATSVAQLRIRINGNEIATIAPGGSFERSFGSTQQFYSLIDGASGNFLSGGDFMTPNQGQVVVFQGPPSDIRWTVVPYRYTTTTPRWVSVVAATRDGVTRSFGWRPTTGSAPAAAGNLPGFPTGPVAITFGVTTANEFRYGVRSGTEVPANQGATVTPTQAANNALVGVLYDTNLSNSTFDPGFVNLPMAASNFP